MKKTTKNNRLPSGTPVPRFLVTAKGGMWQIAPVGDRVALVDLKGDEEGLGWSELKAAAARAPGSARRTLDEIDDGIALREWWPARTAWEARDLLSLAAFARGG